MKKLFSLGLFTLAGCSTGGGYYNDRYSDPDNFYCPSSHFALCEGHTRNQMECRCVDKKHQRSVLRSIYGAI
jgi:hypothetical protein|tara:strand:- start:5833 stop:6048 length:216 start_codon:yes stop_codon:yes gene_type:complete